MVSRETFNERGLSPLKAIARLRNRLVRNQWMVADQALVSGMNFLTTAILARMLGVHTFGIFSVFYIVLLYLNTIPSALNVAPMMSLAPQLQSPEERRSFLRGMAGYQWLLSLSCCAGTIVFLLASRLHLFPWRTNAGIALPFLVTIICFQLQDWFRRFCYVKDDGRSVFWNDMLSYAGQVAAFAVLWWLHEMDVKSAYYSIALTSFVAFGIGFAANDIGTTWQETRSAVSKTWVTGRSLLIAGQFQWLGSQGIYLIVAAVVGVSAASGMRAAMTLIGPVGVLYQLLDNVIPVRAARAFAAGGETDLIAYLRRTSIFLGGLVGVPIIIASIFARPIMSLAFGRAYGVFATLVIWQGVYMWFALLSRCLQYYHRTMGTAVILARSSMLVAAISGTTSILLSKRYGADGGMIALVVGQVLNVVFVTTFSVQRHMKTKARLAG